MSEFERKQIEMDLRSFASRNFIKPCDCKSLEQIRFCVRELCTRIEDLEKRFNYVPQWAYTLLAQYNATQNRMLHTEFRRSYC